MIRINIISITHEGNDNNFHIEYKVNEVLKPSVRYSKYVISEHIAKNNEISQEEALESFTKLLSKYHTKSILFESFLKMVHTL